MYYKIGRFFSTERRVFMNKKIEKIKREIDELLFDERRAVRKALIANGDRKAWERLLIRRVMVLTPPNKSVNPTKTTGR